MNGIESWYWSTIVERVKSGEFLSARYEAITIRLAPKTTWTPDFFIIKKDGTAMFHETKASWKGAGQDVSRVKVKLAAEMYPEFEFSVIMIKNKKVSSVESL